MVRFPHLQAYLDRFFDRRTGVRFLIAHFLDLCYGASVRLGSKFPLLSASQNELFFGKKPGTPGYYYGYGPDDFVGVICLSCDVGGILDMTARSVEAQAVSVLGSCPRIDVQVHSSRPIVHIPHALYTMLSELLKNSASAVVATHGDKAKMPPVTVNACVSERGELTIRVSDEGGGIARSKVSRTLKYLYTTAPEPLYCVTDSSAAPQTLAGLAGISPGGVGSLPFSGYGYGLPIVRQLAQYYRGEFDLVSQEGTGTNCYIFLPALQTTSERTSHWHGVNSRSEPPATYAEPGRSPMFER